MLFIIIIYQLLTLILDIIKRVLKERMTGKIIESLPIDAEKYLGSKIRQMMRLERLS